MRELKTADIFAFVRIIEESGAKEDLVPVIKNITSGASIVDAGIIGMMTLAFSVCKVESKLYKWIANIAEIEPECLQDLDLMANVMESFAESDQTKLKRFFTAALNLLQKIS